MTKQELSAQNKLLRKQLNKALAKVEKLVRRHWAQAAWSLTDPVKQRKRRK